MTKLHYGQCLIGVAIAAVALIALGVSTTTLGFLAVVLACPLMMFVMMRTMMGDNQHGASHDEPVDHSPR